MLENVKENERRMTEMGDVEVYASPDIELVNIDYAKALLQVSGMSGESGM